MPQPADQAIRDALVGLSLLGQFRIEELIGEGQTAWVYAGQQRGVERAVALKVLKPRFLEDEEFLARFEREARLASKLDHPHIARTLIAAEIELGQRVTPALHAPLPVTVFERLAGRSLETWLKEHPAPLSARQALSLLIPIAEALGLAHSQGIVHRDPKPANLLFHRKEEQSLKLTDFGLARELSARNEHATRDGSVLGTPRYMSPEGAQGKPVGPPGDVYSLTCVLFELLTGRGVFEGEGAVELLLAHAHNPAPEISALQPGQPEVLNQLFKGNLGKSPGERDPSGVELATRWRAALEQIAPSSPVSQAGLASAPTPSAASQKSPEAPQATPPAAAAAAPAAPTSPAGKTQVLPPTPSRKAGSTRVLEDPSPSAHKPAQTEPSTPVPATKVPGPVSHATPIPAPPASSPSAHQGGALPVATRVAPATISEPFAISSRSPMPTPAAALAQESGPQPVSTPGPESRPRRGWPLVAVCFLMGAVGAGFAVAKTLPPKTQTKPLSRLAVTNAGLREAAERGAWFTPSGTCVRDLLLRAQADHSSSQEFLETRKQVLEEALEHAVVARNQGKRERARKLVAFVLEFSPPPGPPKARQMLSDLKREAPGAASGGSAGSSAKAPTPASPKPSGPKRPSPGKGPATRKPPTTPTSTSTGHEVPPSGSKGEGSGGWL